MDLRSQMEQLSRFNLALEGQLSPQLAADLIGALNWCEQQPECKGNLGVPRSRMPQLPFGGIPDFLKWLKVKFGTDSKSATMAVGQLRATQREINADKVEKIAKGILPVGDDPLPISKDNYVLDGHHRWAALLSRNPRNRVRVVKIDMPIRQLLPAANQYPGTFQQGFDEEHQIEGLHYSYDRRR